MAAKSAASIGKLREFSTQLAARLQAAPQHAPEPMRLAVRIGAASYLFALETTGEIVALPDVAPVPWTQPWFRGLANVRGRLVSVIDLLAMSGRAPLAEDEARQLLVLGDSMQTAAALLITRAFGLRNLALLETVGTADNAAAPWETGTYRDSDGNLLTQIDLAQLVRSASFSSIGI